MQEQSKQSRTLSSGIFRNTHENCGVWSEVTLLEGHCYGVCRFIYERDRSATIFYCHSDIVEGELIEFKINE